MNSKLKWIFNLVVLLVLVLSVIPAQTAQSGVQRVTDGNGVERGMAYAPTNPLKVYLPIVLRGGGMNQQPTPPSLAGVGF